MITDYLDATPRTKAVIAELSGLSKREVEAQINEARLAGFAVVSDSDGYRLARSPEEAKQCAERLRSRALRQLETASALADAAERMAGPLTLFGQ